MVRKVSVMGSNRSNLEAKCSLPDQSTNHEDTTIHNILLGAPHMPDLIAEVTQDLADLKAFYKVSISEARLQYLQDYLVEKYLELNHTNFVFLNQDGKVDYILLKNYLSREMNMLELEKERNEEMSPLLSSWTPDLVTLVESRQAVDVMEGQRAAELLSHSLAELRGLNKTLADGKFASSENGFAAYRAVNTAKELKMHMEEYYCFYEGYDPLITWWLKMPWRQLKEEMETFVLLVRTKLLGIEPSDDDAIVGQPVGRSGILADLKAEVIAYTPEELIRIAEKEYDWCVKEMVKASRALGFGTEWRFALEHVKNMYVQPGQQTKLVRELAQEAIEYVTERDMVTIPPVAKKWQTFMMTPERQKANPFFLGGSSIIVSYPTDTMSHTDKMMSMRGNSKPFSRSTVFHELIPGHHLQYHYIKRFKTYRRLFDTPFWMEGWAFYWEFILWDRGFPQTPENKIGMLFWRMHRCARIIFSLKFHLGEMTPEQCIDYLVDKVGHERITAEGEVRRSFNGDYPPLYQAGYMLGALQLYALRKELVDGGKTTEKEFHNRILTENEMPIEMLKALLTEQSLSPDHKAAWRFYDL